MSFLTRTNYKNYERDFDTKNKISDENKFITNFSLK